MLKGTSTRSRVHTLRRRTISSLSPFPDEDGSRDPWHGSDLIEHGFVQAHGKGVLMGFRRRTRRRALISGAAIAHHRDRMNADDQAEDEPPAEDDQGQAQYARFSI